MAMSKPFSRSGSASLAASGDGADLVKQIDKFASGRGAQGRLRLNKRVRGPESQTLSEIVIRAGWPGTARHGGWSAGIAVNSSGGGLLPVHSLRYRRTAAEQVSDFQSTVALPQLSRYAAHGVNGLSTRTVRLHIRSKAL